MLITVLSSYILAIFAPMIKDFFGYKSGWILALLPIFIFIYFLSLYNEVILNNSVIEIYKWIPTIGINLSFYLDGISLIFVLLISGIGSFIMIYSGKYLKNHVNQGRFFAFILMFMASMIGAVLASNLIVIFFFWEITSIISFLLIGFNYMHKTVRRAAFQAFIITSLGGIGMLIGFIILGVNINNFEIIEIIKLSEKVKNLDLYVLVLVLVLLGVFTKSAQFPFHFWLPNAMVAPTPVSAFLHSATMVKLGIYLLMRMYCILGNTIEWSIILNIFGAFTLLIGTFIAIKQIDLKRMLAYSSISSLGLMVMLLGIGSENAIKASILYLIAHSLFKGSLFMIVGSVDYKTKIRNITQLSGLCYNMPITFFSGLMASLSMGGIIPFIGFLAKESIYDSLLYGNIYTLILLIITIIGNAFMFAIGFLIVLKPMIGKINSIYKNINEVSIMLWIGPIVLALFGLLIGLIISYLDVTLINNAIISIKKNILEEVHILPDTNWSFIFSLLTIFLGVLIYLNYNKIYIFFNYIFNLINWKLDKWLDYFFINLFISSQLITQKIQNGNLRSYMHYIFILLNIMIWGSMFFYNSFPNINLIKLFELTFSQAGILVIAMLGLYSILFTKFKLIAILSLGILGFSIAIIFVMLGAPDLSLTQFVVEILSIIILSLILPKLNLNKSDYKCYLNQIIISSIFGVGITLLLLRIVEVEFNMNLSNFFIKYSTLIAHGHNIVNVILVDFRALDTLGEISVVMITGVVILLLVNLKIKKFNIVSKKKIFCIERNIK